MLYAPKYYPRFVCIADKCRHSCCVGWEIDVDAATMRRYAALTEPYAACVRESIEQDEVPHFRLDDHERCPHLNEQGLCRIILALGEDGLCDICREHPRFYHETPHGTEVGLGMACEEACRLILGSDAYSDFVALDVTEEEVEAVSFDATAHRASIYAMLSDRTVPYIRRLQAIMDTFGVSPCDHLDDEWRTRLASLEYLDETHRAQFACYSSDLTPTAQHPLLERALAYFVFRHCSDARDADEFRTSLGFALLCERLLASLIRNVAAATASDVFELARAVSEELEYSEDNTEALRDMFF